MQTRRPRPGAHPRLCWLRTLQNLVPGERSTEDCPQEFGAILPARTDFKLGSLIVLTQAIEATILILFHRFLWLNS